MDQLKAELGRKCQLCYFQSQEIQKLRQQVKEAELLSIENESLTVSTRDILYIAVTIAQLIAREDPLLNYNELMYSKM